MDNCKNYVIGAKNAGMISIQIKHNYNKSATEKCQPDFIFSNYKRLSKIIDDLKM
jgi:FMN phosphatase YigB (HAD superfamily)